jgi:hypothetical protein
MDPAASGAPGKPLKLCIAAILVFVWIYANHDIVAE